MIGYKNGLEFWNSLSENPSDYANKIDGKNRQSFFHVLHFILLIFLRIGEENSFQR